MKEIINYITYKSTYFLETGGIFIGIILMILESIIPLLPLGVFIAFIIKAYGFILGFIISWLATSIGCLLSYLLCKNYLKDIIYKFASKRQTRKINKIKEKITSIPFTHLVVIIALPFTPAFLINVSAGLSNMSTKKFLVAILIGKISIVYFWGFVGSSLLTSVTDIKTITIISLMLIIAYFLSKILEKKIHIN